MKDLLRNIYFVINFRRMVGAEKHFSSLPRYFYANSQTKIENISAPYPGIFMLIHKLKLKTFQLLTQVFLC